MATAADTNDYEEERLRRIAQNRAMLMDIGVDTAARDLAASQTPNNAGRRPASRPRQPRSVPALLHTERRRSSRTEGRPRVNYGEDFLSGDWETRAPRQRRSAPNLQALTEEEVERIRAQHGVHALEAYQQGQEGGQGVQGSVDDALAARNATPRKRVDSGKGVRIQFGKVYDSQHGITCHWCRQKTLEDHVTCTHPNCGKGKKMPTTFCANCLKNRHGEDQRAAAASGQWVCPPCRGTCGPGCVSCCNCGPCRKKLNLEPTRQMLTYARSQGFDNAHDYLVHLVTGEGPEAIKARKTRFPWGQWLLVQDQDAEDEDTNTDIEGEGAEEGHAAADAAPQQAPQEAGTEAAGTAGGGDAGDAGGTEGGGAEGAAPAGTAGNAGNSGGAAADGSAADERAAAGGADGAANGSAQDEEKQDQKEERQDADKQEEEEENEEKEAVPGRGANEAGEATPSTRRGKRGRAQSSASEAFRAVKPKAQSTPKNSRRRTRA